MRLAFLVTAAFVAAGWTIPAAAQPEARIETSLGTIVVLLESDKAPATVANFIRYAKQGHFNNTVIYRIVPGFVVQTGSMKPDNTWKAAGKPIPLETANGLSNKRGTLAMARDDKPASATKGCELMWSVFLRGIGVTDEKCDGPSRNGPLRRHIGLRQCLHLGPVKQSRRSECMVWLEFANCNHITIILTPRAVTVGSIKP